MLEREAKPIFITGLDRSGKTWLRKTLQEHPHIFLGRKTYFWSRINQKFGRLGNEKNLRRCFDELNRHGAGKFIPLNYDGLREQFRGGEQSYARLYAILMSGAAAMHGKTRWGEQAAGLEYYAQAILAAFPEAKIIHLLRNPFSRLADYPGRNALKAGKEAARWVDSYRRGESWQRRNPEHYRLIQMECLVERPLTTLEQICEFIQEPLVEEVIRDGQMVMGRPDKKRRAGLSTGEKAFLESYTRKTRQQAGYASDPVRMEGRRLGQYLAGEYPRAWLGVLSWKLTRSLSRKGVD